MNTLHFNSGDYLTIKNNAGNYSFAGRGKYEMLEHQGRLTREIERKQRQLDALIAYLDGESESNPEALR